VQIIIFGMNSQDFTLSRILSVVLHPLLIPTIAISALMLQPGIYSIILPYRLYIWFLSLIIIFTLGIPVSSVFILLKFKAVDSIELNHRSERTIPLLIASSSYMALLYFLKPTNIPPVFLYVLYSATFALLAGLLINMFYKISLHTLGWGALAATLASLSIHLGIPMLAFIVVSILLSGIVGYARLKQNAHNQTQVYVGYLAGVCIVLLITLLS
jgi:hypothetical protein